MLTIETENNNNGNNSQHQQQDMIVNERKENKIAAAKQMLKQFKKKDGNRKSDDSAAAVYHNLSNGSQNHLTATTAITNDMNDLRSNSGRSTPSSNHSQTTSSSSYQLNTNNNNNNNNKAAASMATTSVFPLPATPSPPINISSAQFKEQIQLHVQTIGILVAEKAELQSKLQQQNKKCDKKQDECDELAGRLKASRQKIADLERLIQQLNSQSLTDTDSSNQQQHQQHQQQQILGERDLLIDELRARLTESQQRLDAKQQDVNQLAQLTIDLKTQLEMSQLKINQLINQATSVSPQEGAILAEPTNEQTLSSVNSQLQKANSDLEKQLLESKSEREKLTNTIDRMQKQLESLVDQINRLTDEREDAFSKIDRLESMLSNANDLNRQLAADLNDMQLKQQQSKLSTNEPKQQQQTGGVGGRDDNLVKIDLLENEIKYFKQQIDILLKEDVSTKRLLAEREQAVVNLNKLLENYEADREKYAALLEQNHNDKQTISRILSQNNELKTQLVELQDAYVNVTKVNLDLTTQLQTEQFKLKQLNETVMMMTQSTNHQNQNGSIDNNSSSSRLSAEWGDDEQTNGHVQSKEKEDDQNDVKDNESGGGDGPPKETIMDNIKRRIVYLEKENKDLNDYIVLMNRQIEDNGGGGRTVNGETGNGENGDNHLRSLLEDKFKKVMEDNADLREANQQLEHVIQQLQFETETIVDYITMYQMERTKLNDKYKIKDELIRSLSTQLQVNKLALNEISNYLNAYLRTPGEDESDKQKRDYLLVQIQNLLANITVTSQAKLTLISNSVSEMSSSSKLPELRQKPAQLLQQSVDYSNSEDQLAAQVASFRNETVLCSFCYGDLFVV